MASMRMYEVGGKLLNGMNNVYVKDLACVRVKGCESECFRIDSGVRHVCIMSPWLFNVYTDAMMEWNMGIGRKGERFQEEAREWRLPGLLYADNLVLCGESEVDLRAIGGSFIEVCRRRGLKVSAGKSKVMLLGGEEGLECEVWVNRISLEYVSEFKYLGCVLHEAEGSSKVTSGRRVAGALRSLVNGRGLQLECARILHE